MSMFAKSFGKQVVLLENYCAVQYVVAQNLWCPYLFPI